MSKLTIILLFLIIVSCSAPRYTYNFDHYSVRNKTSVVKDKTDVKDISNNSANGLTSSLDYVSSDFSNDEKALTATSSKGISFLPRKMIVKKANVLSDTLPEINSEKNEEVIANKKAGNKKKNGLAVLGLTSSALGWVFVFLVPGGAMFLFLIGFILSAMGFKSQRKALAIIGFVLGIIPILYLIFGLFWIHAHPSK